jgi:hypothetical protein
MSNRAVMVGGFTTGKRLLEPFADAICARFGFADADVFEFTVIDDTSKLERALKRQTAFVHSAGLLAVAECVGMERVAAFNSPEPTKVARLLANAAIKSGNLWKTAITGPHRMGAARVVASNNIQAIAHPLAHGRQIAVVSRFSTTAQLALMEAAGVPTARIDTDGDEFFGPHTLHEWDGKRAVLPGSHDQVLVDPVGFVAQLPEEALAS